MKKIHVVVQGKDSASALEALSTLGTVHVEYLQKPEGAEIARLQEEAASLRRIEAALANERTDNALGKPADIASWAKEVTEALNRIQELEEAIAGRTVEMNRWAPWGDFSPEDVEGLREKNFDVQLLKIPLKALADIPRDVVLEKIFIEQGLAHCVAVSPGKITLPFEPVRLPKTSLSRMQSLQEKDQQSLQEARRKIRGYAPYQAEFGAYRRQLEFDLSYQELLKGMGQTENLVYLKGYCPAESVPRLEAAAQKEQWALLIEDPAEDEPVPTLLRNPRWVEIIKPVFQLMNIVPGYRETDVSIVFLLFFSVFFGILIGDAAYGLIFALATGWVHRKWGKRIPDKTPIFLMYVLSGFAVLWGALTGTFFGQEWLAPGVGLPWLKDNLNVQLLCFIIGVVQLSIARLWRIVVKFPHISFLGEVGWLSLLWGMFFGAKTLVLNIPFPSWAKIFFIVGAACVILFSSPRKSLGRTVGAGLGSFLLKITNTFTDIVSYIRLFAVGLASVAIADVFNSMAMGMGFGDPLKGLTAALILVIGHVFNLVLGSLAVLVHGLRLNVLEFSGHLDMEWAGREY
ncbi:MAG: hypothetical protein WC552_07490, partial [Candidatus Omnitrophota bacterium]